MFSLILILSMLFAVVVDLPNKGLFEGKHWDCEAIAHMEVDFKTDDEAYDAIKYCSSNVMSSDDPVYQRSWKDGSIVHK